MTKTGQWLARKIEIYVANPISSCRFGKSQRIKADLGGYFMQFLYSKVKPGKNSLYRKIIVNIYFCLLRSRDAVFVKGATN